MWQPVSYYLLLAIEALIGVFGIRVYEEPPYQVVGRVDHVEIRRYAPRVAAEVTWSVANNTGRAQAFRLLFAYIAGANRPLVKDERRIAMTAPVEVVDRNMTPKNGTAQTSEGGARMRFFLPAKYRLDDVPTPSDSRVVLVTIPEETVAVLRFSGSGSDFAERQSELIRQLQGSAWKTIGTPYALYYDPPFTLPFLRRNGPRSGWTNHKAHFFNSGRSIAKRCQCAKATLRDSSSWPVR